jgi:hypothetical protein
MYAMTQLVGNTITWRTSLSSHRDDLEVGFTRFSNLRAYTEQGDPLLAFSPNPSNLLTGDTGVDLALDTARSTAVYTLR